MAFIQVTLNNDETQYVNVDHIKLIKAQHGTTIIDFINGDKLSIADKFNDVIDLLPDVRHG
ncbi:flagellar FlbD family protein [Bacillus paralicheniformis]|uniref:flagellar FlbD family protein n=1 Tax=Bacillus subtilis group TaxID=653685 RepID=UPI000BE05075|nr:MULTISPECIES: flagellar FlbD family protein [Bacillus subtilis group]MBU5327684.1 flagellar FlbD family protein [Bacillus paralicheniformis]MCA1183433.1 flagellar FlbD family protein [Bacillus licheniformis]MCV9368973.1 flagellar FlbD family protein [Bacillus paralicheniformis]MCY7743684.1 flagellar FlbD family protein [Bacillus licheniformis]MEB3127475.1 flagellar FlbD family protein [Bacillus paralicheniformis]